VIWCRWYEPAHPPFPAGRIFPAAACLHHSGTCASQIVHDEELKRVARPEQARTISCHPAEELTAVDVGSWFSSEYHAERIPTLAAVLSRYRGRIHLQLV